MGSPIEELQRREAAARREADELRSEIARLSERLARAEEMLARLEVTRETVTEILGDAGAGQAAGAAGPVPGGSRPAGGSPVGAVKVPPWRPGLAQSVLPTSYQDLLELDADLISAFLDHLEADRGNSARTRNARLAAIRSLFRHAAWQAPEHAATIQRVLAISGKRTSTTVISFLTDEEAQALLDAPGRQTRTGRRDSTLLLLALRTGLRVSELTQLTCGDIHLGREAHVRCLGKGRKERYTPLEPSTVAALRDWLAERGTSPDLPLFCTRQGRPLSPDAIQARLTKYHALAARNCPSLATKKISPHTLRHSTAMSLLHAGVDIAVLALWLGHESTKSTQAYIHADMKLKEQALARMTPAGIPGGRYAPSDPLLAFLENL